MNSCPACGWRGSDPAVAPAATLPICPRCAAPINGWANAGWAAEMAGIFRGVEIAITSGYRSVAENVAAVNRKIERLADALEEAADREHRRAQGIPW